MTAFTVYVVAHPDTSEPPYVFATEDAATAYLGTAVFAERCPVLTVADVAELLAEREPEHCGSDDVTDGWCNFCGAEVSA